MISTEQRDQVIQIVVDQGGDPSLYSFIPKDFNVLIKDNSTGKELTQIDRLDLDDNNSANAIKKIKAIL